MPVELLGPALFILMSVAFFWASKQAGQGVAITLAFGRLALAKQVPTHFKASSWTWILFATSILVTAVGISALIYGGWRIFYCALVLGDAVVVTSVAIVLSVCSIFFVSGFSSFRGFES